MKKKYLPTNQPNFFLYTGNDGKVNVEVFLKDGTVWHAQKALAELFCAERSVITKHLGNIFEDGELVENSVCAISAHTASDGKKYKTKFYNLAAIISAGYRVNSYQANRIFSKDYFDKGIY